MGIFEATHGWGGGGGAGGPPKNLSYISYNDETRHRYTLSKEDPKNYEKHMNHVFFLGNQHILLYQEIQI